MERRGVGERAGIFESERLRSRPRDGVLDGEREAMGKNGIGVRIEEQ